MTQTSKISALAQSLMGLVLAAAILLGADKAEAAVPHHVRHGGAAFMAHGHGRLALSKRGHSKAKRPALHLTQNAGLRGGLSPHLAASPALQAASQATASAAPRPAPPAQGETRPGLAPVFNYDDELILEITTPHQEMTDSITAHASRTAVYLPLGAVARFLDLPIAISDDGHYASGWFLDEKRQMRLNVREGKLTVNGKNITLTKTDAVAFDGELYLRLEKFAEIFPIEVKLDMRAQQVIIKTLEPFPYEQRLAREAARDRVAGRLNASGQHHFPREETPYKGLTVPLGDVELRAMTDPAQHARTEADLRLAGDVLWMSGRVFLSASSVQGLSAAHIELGRRDPDAQLLGPLHATDFEMGDVSTNAMPIGIRSVAGRGVSLTNAPLEHTSIFDTINLTGDLPQGYEVELYRNNNLIASTRTPVNGQYQFLAVAVDYGLNVFRLVFYGPQGQRREEVRRISVGDGRLSKGQLIYAVDAAQKDTSLINVHLPNYSPLPDAGSWRGSAQIRYGLTAGVTVNAGAGIYQSLGGQEQWLTYAGLRTGLGGAALKLDVAAEQGGGMAASVGIGGRLAGVSYVLSHNEYGNGFTDEVRVYSAQPLRRADQADLTATLHLGSGDHRLSVPMSASVSRIEYATGEVDTTAALRQSLAFSRFLATNELDYTSTSIPGSAATTRTTGTFDLSSLSGSRTHLRAGLGYTVGPHLAISSAEVAVDSAIDERTLLKAGILHAMTNNLTTLSFSASRRFSRFTLAADTSFAVPTNAFTASLRLNFSFGQNPLTGKMFAAPVGLASGGAVAVRAYRDENGNHQYDPGEEVLKDVEFSTGSRFAHTDAHGVAFLGGMGDGTRASYKMDTESLPDIALAPYSDGVEIVPRAGRIHVSQFGVVALSDIEGSATYLADGAARGVSGLTLWIVDGAGKHVARARSEADGFFLFEQLRPGQYSLIIDPAQAAALHIHLTTPQAITIGAKNDVIRLKIQIASDAVAAAPEKSPETALSAPKVPEGKATIAPPPHRAHKAHFCRKRKGLLRLRRWTHGKCHYRRAHTHAAVFHVQHRSR